MKLSPVSTTCPCTTGFILIFPVYPDHITAVFAQPVIHIYITGNIGCILTRIGLLQLKIAADAHTYTVVKQTFRYINIQICLIRAVPVE